MNADILESDPKLLGADHGQSCVGALPHVLGAHEEIHLAVDVDLHQCRGEGL